MSTYEGTLFDSHDELGLGFADVDYRLHCTVDPGHPAGTDEPATADIVDVDHIEIDAVRPQDGTALARPLTEAELDKVRQFVDRKTLQDWAAIKAEILDRYAGSFEPDIDDCGDFDDADTYRSIGWGCDEDYGTCLGDEL